MEKIKAREIEELQQTIEENNKQLEQLKHHNDELSKIIHKDNKLIPAMEYAVREYLLSSERTRTKGEHLSRGKELLEQLAYLSHERSGIINHYEVTHKKLIPTNVPSIDTLFSYMLQKARGHQISFDVSLSGDMAHLVGNMIDDADLRTLLADLLDNAIIATKRSPKKNIMVNLEITGICYSIDIFDSGDLFEDETLAKLGKAQTTTHANEGGSGIGLMTAFDMVEKYQISFVIEELPFNHLFSKKITVCFDNLGQFRIITQRTEAKDALLSRTDLVFVREDEYGFKPHQPASANSSSFVPML